MTKHLAAKDYDSITQTLLSNAQSDGEIAPIIVENPANVSYGDTIEKVVERVHGKQTVGLNNPSRNITGDQGKSSGGNYFQRAPSHRTLNMAALPYSMNEVANHTSLGALE